ncbi:MAG: hypothetical protein Q4D55_04755 [Eubacteriales bacterium]|nr:hypothetical protein [Eubacteriales bacterium]
MSGYILCQQKKAEQPYFIENISTNIYSMEELCYYLYHNLYLVDRTILEEGLCSWLEKELELPKLAAKLRPHLGKFASAEDVLYPVFKEINYLTYEELKWLNAQLAKMETESPLLRQKKKGDALMENGMLVSAIHVYEGLLKEEGLEEAHEGLTGLLWHNLGCAYSYLFQMEKAAECFWEAWEQSEAEEELEAYLLAFHAIRTSIEYESRLQELGADPALRERVNKRLQDFGRKPERPVYSQHVDPLLETFTREYHRSTGS